MRINISAALEVLESALGANRYDDPAQSEAPYSTALRQVTARRNRAAGLRHRLQAPGHAGTLPRRVRRALGRHYARYDVSVVKGLDVSLNGQKTPLVQAEERLAAATGAKQASLFTNGASMVASAVMSALIEVAGRRKILVVRNAHISVLNTAFEGLAHLQILPVEVHQELGMAMVLDPADLEAALKSGDDIGGVWLSSPCYEGVGLDLAKCIALCHEAGVPVVVDGSWASEMPFTDALGRSPIKLGADMVVGSPHKTLRAPGQAAWAFLGNDELVPTHVFATAMLRHKTTSKSSNVLAALDECRRWAVAHTTRGIERNNAAVAKFSRRYLPAGVLVDWAEELRNGKTVAPASIPYRMTVRTWQLGYTGYEIEKILREQHGVQVAQANLRYIFIGTGVDNPRTIKAGLKAIGKVLKALPERRPLDLDSLPPLVLTGADVDFGELRGRRIEVVSLGDAVNRVLADPLGAYPPGIAVKVAGEVLDERTGRFFVKVLELGGTLYGGDPALLAKGLVRVYADEVAPAPATA